jgi:hypothetical protein
MIMQLLIGVGGIGATILAAVSPGTAEDFADILLVLPLLSVAGASVYLDLSSSVYSAESYIERAARRGVAEFFPLRRRLARELRDELWSFESAAERSRRSREVWLVGAVKFLGAFLLPVVVALLAFSLIRPLSGWKWYEWLGVISDVALVGAVIWSARRIQRRKVQTPER